MRITDWDLTIGEMCCAVIVNEVPVPCYNIRDVKEKYKACFIEDEEEPFTIRYHTKTPGFAEAVEAKLIIDGNTITKQITPVDYTIVRDAQVPPPEQGFKFQLFGFPGQEEYENKVLDERFGVIILELRLARLSRRSGRGVHASNHSRPYDVNPKADYTFQFQYRPTQFLIECDIIYSTSEDETWWAEEPIKKSSTFEAIQRSR